MTLSHFFTRQSPRITHLDITKVLGHRVALHVYMPSRTLLSYQSTSSDTQVSNYHCTSHPRQTSSWKSFYTNATGIMSRTQSQSQSLWSSGTHKRHRPSCNRKPGRPPTSTSARTGHITPFPNGCCTSFLLSPNRVSQATSRKQRPTPHGSQMSARMYSSGSGSGYTSASSTKSKGTATTCAKMKLTIPTSGRMSIPKSSKKACQPLCRVHTPRGAPPAGRKVSLRGRPRRIEDTLRASDEKRTHQSL